MPLKKEIQVVQKNPLQRYLNAVIKNHRTLQLFGVHADTPVIIDLENIYVSLKVTRQQEEPGVSALRTFTIDAHIVSSQTRQQGEPGVSALRELQGLNFEELEQLDSEVRVSRQLAPEKEDDVGGAFIARHIKQSVAVPEAMQSTKRLVVLGDPGCGKTTLLKYLALTFAAEKSEERLSLQEERVPIFLRLWDLGTYLAQNEQSSESEEAAQVLGCIEERVKTMNVDLPDRFLIEALRAGDCILLFDGLDEVAEINHRVRAAQAIGAFVEAYPENRYVVTARIQGYRGVPPFSGGFEEAYVNDFSDEDVSAFIQSWYKAVRGTLTSPIEQLRADESSQDLQRVVESNPKIRELAKNPLLLSTIALVHYNRIRLPERRAELYDECTAFLLGFWDYTKGLDADEKIYSEIGHFGRDAKRELLEPIALWFHQQGQSGFMADRETLQSKLAEELQQMTGYADMEKMRRVASIFLDLACERSGLLIEREKDYFAFSHLTFQEYLAARRLAYSKDYIEFILNHLHESWWHEVILLTVGHLSSENNPTARKRAAELVQAIRRANSEFEQYLKRDLLLAGSCLVDTNPAGIYHWLRDEIAGELLQIYDETLFSRLRSEAFGRLVGIWREMHSADFIDTLIRKLQDKNYKVRVEAAYALGELGKSDKAVIDALMEALHDEDHNVRMLAAYALRELGKSDKAAIDALMRVLHDEDYNVRSGAAVALGELGKSDKVVIDALMKALHDEYYNVRSGAAVALGELGKSDKVVIDALIEALHDEYSMIRARATTALGELGKSDIVIDVLMKALHDENYRVRAGAAVALGELGKSDKVVIDALIEALHDEYSMIRARATTALGELGKSDKAVIDALIKALYDEDFVVRSRAAEVLGKLGKSDKAVIDALMKALYDEDFVVRSRAAEVLVKSGQQIGKYSGIVEYFIHCLSDEEPDRRAKSASILAKIGQHEVTSQLAEMIDEPRNRTEVYDYIGGLQATVAEAAFDSLWDLVVGSNA